MKSSKEVLQEWADDLVAVYNTLPLERYLESRIHLRDMHQGDCDERERQQAVIDAIERRMEREKGK